MACRLLSITSAVLLVPALLLLGVGLIAPASGWGIGALVGLVAVAVGLLIRGRWRHLTRIAAALLLVVLLLRCAVVRGDDPSIIRMITLSSSRAQNTSGGTKLRSKIVPERDLALSGSRLLELQGTVPRGFPDLLGAAYDRMERELGPLPSALPATYLGQQSPESFDTVIVAPGGESRPSTALVFLHGYAGNVTLLCWTVARAVRPQGILTACPSVGFEGDWWSADGARTLRATLEHLRRRGIRRFFLAGLSNGARGASILAPRFRRQLAGLVLLSGLSGRAGRPGVPVLMVYGRRDPAAPPQRVRAYVRRARAGVRRVTLPGDHFVLLTREAAVRAAIARWIQQRIRQRS
jgi:pimeloyl-ACP methyl ester carboxylesterase